MKSASKDWREWRIDADSYLIRSLSVDIIRKVEDGRLLDETIDRSFSRLDVREPLKALLYEITAGVLRRKGYLDWVLSHYVRRSLKQDVRYILWTALYQAFFMRKGVHHVVNETVEYVKKEKGAAVANFVNAVLRKAAREGRALALPEDPLSRLSVAYSFPEWLVRRWVKQLGEQGSKALLTTMNRAPEFSLRVDERRIALDAAVRKIEGVGLVCRPGSLLPSAITVDRIGPLLNHELFRSRLVHVQDEASQLVGHAVAAEPGQLVLDACAGIGTKTEQMLELFPDTRLIAMDLRTGALTQDRPRLGIIRGDALYPPFKERLFDAILLDAPCSSLGIIRKHPEIKWRRKEEEIARYGKYQRALLNAVWPCLKQKGYCIYSVCSFEPEETLDVLRNFAADKQFILENPLPFLFNKEYFLSLPHETGVDGFFIARLRKA